MDSSRLKKILMNPWTPLCAGIVIIGLMLAVHAFLQEVRSGKPEHGQAVRYPSADTLHAAIREAAALYGLSGEIRVHKKRGMETWRIPVPANKSMVSIHHALQLALERHGVQILNGSSDPVRSQVLLDVGVGDSCLIRIVLHPREGDAPEAGRIALIIDDFGERWNASVQAFFTLGTEISISVIPGMKNSRLIAEEAGRYGIEVLLHIPMEPEGEIPRGYAYMIMAGARPSEISLLVQQMLDEVPTAVGVNNHMGSKATANTETMRAVMSEIKARRFFFIDSRTIATTVACDVARELGVPTAQRSIFLDVEPERETIRESLWELARKSGEKGSAIGIGHPIKETLEVLREEIPKIQAKGYLFVRASEVVR